MGRKMSGEEYKCYFVAAIAHMGLKIKCFSRKVPSTSSIFYKCSKYLVSNL